MSVTQLRPRKSATSQGNLPVGLRDALDTEIRFAQAIELAIIGEAEICGFDADDLTALTTAHVERLRAIAEGLGGAS
jgi:hypothetical protein